jgi:hypothetical protein
MKLSRFTFDIIGVSPIMFHNAASMKQHDPNALKGAKKETQAEHSLESSLYINSEGNLYVSSAAFRNALIAASKGRKIGRTGAAFVIQGSVFPIADEITLLDPKTKKPIPKTAAIEDRRSAVNSNCKPPARIIVIRPKLLAWSCKLELEIDETLVNVAVVEEILGIAGRVIGVGAFRVEKKGTFGRFDAKLRK